QNQVETMAEQLGVPKTQQAVTQALQGRRQQGRVAILAAGPSVSSAVADIAAQPYLIIIDLASNSYAVSGTVSIFTLPGLLDQYNAAALICSNMYTPVANVLAGKGIAVYSGIVGSANDAIGLYESGRLVAVR
ncbi:MAG: hypothetical protein WCQ99_12305, partial [Pseudomonadota bacterium]